MKKGLGILVVAVDELLGLIDGYLAPKKSVAI